MNGDFGGGKGIKDNPYLIEDYYDFDNLRNIPHTVETVNNIEFNIYGDTDNLVYIKVVNDIIYRGKENFDMLTGSWYIDFNGNGKKIKNIRYIGEGCYGRYDNSLRNWSIFDVIAQGKIYDLTMEDIFCEISNATSVTSYVSGLARNIGTSSMTGDINIENIIIKGYLRSEGDTSGLASAISSNGTKGKTVIENCIVACSLYGQNCYGLTANGSSSYASCCKSKCKMYGTFQNRGIGDIGLFNCEAENEFYTAVSTSGFGLSMRDCINSYSHSRCMFSEKPSSSIYVYGLGKPNNVSKFYNCYFDADIFDYNGVGIEIKDSENGVKTENLKDIKWLKEKGFPM